jgi:hypothetical protein
MGWAVNPVPEESSVIVTGRRAGARPGGRGPYGSVSGRAGEGPQRSRHDEGVLAPRFGGMADHRRGGPAGDRKGVVWRAGRPGNRACGMRNAEWGAEHAPGAVGDDGTRGESLVDKPVEVAIDEVAFLGGSRWDLRQHLVTSAVPASRPA